MWPKWVQPCPRHPKVHPLDNKVTELVIGKAMSEGLRTSGTNSTLMALHIIPESQLDSFDWQKK